MTCFQKPNDLVESFSGVRGIYGKSITEDFAKRYAFCYCELFKEKLSVFVIGGDTRPSTEALKKAMIDELTRCGVKKIIDVGVVPVQVISYAVLKFKAQGGCAISASHNEPEFNGWKFLKEDGAILFPEQLEKLVKLVHERKDGRKERNSFLMKGRSFAPSIIVNKQREAIDAYIDFISEKIGKSALKKIRKARFKILVDPNGGAGIEVLKRLFNKLSVEAKIINNTPGVFARLIEPKADSLAPLAKELKNDEFQFACGFDCDADRVEFVLSPDSDFAKRMGTAVISGHYVLALTCDTLLEGTTRQVVVTNDATSYLVRALAEKHQAIVKEVEVGEINVVKEMEANNSVIGGEGSCSGVIILPIKCRDGIMSVALTLKMLVDKQKSLSEILRDYPQYYSARELLPCPAESVLAVKTKIENYFKGKGHKIQKTGDQTGGLKVLFDNNSFLWCRESKTEPGIFRLHAEADQSQAKANRILAEGIKVFKRLL